jgi:SAM-dependent methyltransferase
VAEDLDPASAPEATNLPEFTPPSFAGVAACYERGRPGYPDALIDEVLAYSGVARPRLIEVGAGTGKATRLFAHRDCDIVAVEPSPEMAAMARATCAPPRKVVVVEATFEDFELDDTGFDLLVSAQAWHWVSRAVRYPKAHLAVRGTGALAVFWSHPRWDATPYRQLLMEPYLAHAPELVDCGPWFPGFGRRAGLERPSESELAPLFGGLSERRYRWDRQYTADLFLELLRSLVEHETLSADRRARLFDATAHAIDSLGESMTLSYETRLYLTTAKPITT